MLAIPPLIGSAEFVEATTPEGDPQMKALLAAIATAFVLVPAIPAADATAQEIPVKTPEQCVQEKVACETLMYGQYGSVAAPTQVLIQCEPAFQQCLAYAAAAANPPTYTPAPAPAPVPKEIPIEAQVMVVRDVDVYDAPGGTGSVIGMLRRHQEVIVWDPCVENWCHVEGEGVPRSSGYVYSGPEFESLHFN
jgi:hypothetical protein